jgi:hypothetical protein
MYEVLIVPDSGLAAFGHPVRQRDALRSRLKEPTEP